MAKFHGKVGYGSQIESVPGVWEEVITERSYYGDVLRNSKLAHVGEKVNDNLGMSNSISIVSDSFATENISAIKYVEVSGVKWTVTSVEIQRPRLLLQLGEVYNGPHPA